MSNVVPISDGVADRSARPLPCNPEAEEAFLGALLSKNDIFSYVASIIDADHFSTELNRRIFTIASEMIGEGRLANPITVRPFLGEHDLGGGLTIAGYLARISAAAAPSATARDYAAAVRELSIRRSIIKVAREAEDQAFDAPADLRTAQMASATMDRFAVLADDLATSRRTTAGASAGRLVARVQDIMAGSAPTTAISTGFTDLDDATGGYRPGELWIVAGRPGMGKSIVAVTSAAKVARAGHGVLAFSLELPEEQFTARLLADLCYSSRRPIGFGAIMRGQLDDTDLWAVCDAQKRLETMPIVIDYSSRLSPSDIKARIHAEKNRMASSKKQLRVVFIDYLKFVQASDRYRGNRVYEVGEISAALKATAKDEEICVVLLAQLNRALEARDDKRPVLSDLRESGDLEADADVVAFIHREAYYLEKSAKARSGDIDTHVKLGAVGNKAELILGKNRAGPCKTIDLFCSVACSTMSTLVKHEDEFL